MGGRVLPTGTHNPAAEFLDCSRISIFHNRHDFAVVVAIVALAYIPAMMLLHRRPEDTADDKPAAAALAH